MFEFFGAFADLISDILNFIGSFISIVFTTIETLIYVIPQIISLPYYVINILPNEFISVSIVYLGLISSVLIYKLVRKG